MLKTHSFPSELWPAWTSFAYSEITAGQTLSVRIRKSGDQRQPCKFFWMYLHFFDTVCLQLRLVVTLHLYLLGTANLISWEKLEMCNVVSNKFSNSLKCYEFPKRLAVLAVGDVGKSQNPRQWMRLQRHGCVEASWSKANKKIFEMKMSFWTAVDKESWDTGWCS